MLLTIMGLFISYALDIASGASIILLLASAFIISSAIKRLKKV
jgi:ABC-type Mn2+/Zn2+ transport system permease subunit